MSGLAVDSGRGAAAEEVARGGVSVLEGLGQAWYGLASRTARPPLTGTMTVVAELGERFGVGRRTLNYLTDRHLYVRRGHWFGDPGC